MSEEQSVLPLPVLNALFAVTDTHGEPVISVASGQLFCVPMYIEPTGYNEESIVLPVFLLVP